MTNKIAEKLRMKVIKNFMDILILTEIKNTPLSGYDVIGLVHKRYDIVVSSGTIYSLLYSLEREGVIKGVQNQRKRVYELTEKGERDIEIITKANGQIQSFLRNMSSLKG